MPSNQTAIQHPCNAWAISAGLTSWAAALDDMRAGKVLCGTLHAVSPGSKSTLGLQLFLEQVSKEGLHVVFSEMGDCMAGLKSSFPAQLLAAQQAQAKALMRRYDARVGNTFNPI